MIGVRSHYASGTGALAIETREEKRVMRDIIAELPTAATIATIAAPSGIVKDARTGRQIDQLAGLPAAYAWTAAAPGRCLIVWDWHTLANAPGSWRMLIESLPALRSPKGASDTDPASLVIFVGPAFELTPANPLRGALPILPYAPPNREAIERTAASLAPLPADQKDAIVDALCGLSADSAEQAAAEVLARGQGWNVAALQSAKSKELQSAGLEIWEPESELGGLDGFKTYCERRVFPHLRHPKLSVRRLLMAGLPGTGKSYCAKWLAHRLGCKAARLSIPALKAGIVGASEGNLRRALRTIESMSKDSPIVVVLDEIDTIARDGLDGGTSSGMFAELLTWLEESKKTCQAVVLATLNRLDKLDAALESRFGALFCVDLPTQGERRSVAEIYLRQFDCDNVEANATIIAEHTHGFSNREISQRLIPDVAAYTDCKPTAAVISEVALSITPASKSQQDQLAQMRKAAATLRRANSPEDYEPTPLATRKIQK